MQSVTLLECPILLYAGDEVMAGAVSRTGREVVIIVDGEQSDILGADVSAPSDRATPSDACHDIGTHQAGERSTPVHRVSPSVPSQ